MTDALPYLFATMVVGIAAAAILFSIFRWPFEKLGDWDVAGKPWDGMLEDLETISLEYKSFTGKRPDFMVRVVPIGKLVQTPSIPSGILPNGRKAVGSVEMVKRWPWSPKRYCAVVSFLDGKNILAHEVAKHIYPHSEFGDWNFNHSRTDAMDLNNRMRMSLND